MVQPEVITTRRGRLVQLRPITPEDDILLVRLFHRLSPETRWRRFLDPLPDMSDRQITAEAHRLAAIDPRREVALLATICEDGATEVAGVSRFAIQRDDPQQAEFAILVRDDYQGEGLGKLLLQRLIGQARQRGLSCLWGITFSENRGILHLVQHCGVPAHLTYHRGELRLDLDLLSEGSPSLPR